MVHGNASGVPKMGRQVIAFMWIIVRRMHGTAQISALAGILARKQFNNTAW
jgi:hypothetical protein